MSNLKDIKFQKPIFLLYCTSASIVSKTFEYFVCIEAGQFSNEPFWMSNMLYLVDITSHINDFNLKLKKINFVSKCFAILQKF